MPLIERADVLVEQFRPGVMARLGLGYEALRAINPKLIYCSITGYGQSGPRADEAGHDINYIGHTGLLALQPGPARPPDRAAGADRRHRRRHLSGGDQHPAGAAPARPDRAGLHSRHRHDRRDVHLREARARHRVMRPAGFPAAAATRLTGGSPRYQLYPTQRRQARRLRRAGAEVLAGVHRGDRACAGVRRRPPRSGGDQGGGRGDHRGARRRTNGGRCLPRPIAASPIVAHAGGGAARSAFRRARAVCAPGRRAHPARPCRRCRCRSIRRFARGPNPGGCRCSAPTTSLVTAPRRASAAAAKRRARRPRASRRGAAGRSGRCR